MSKFRILNPDMHGGVFWDARSRVWRTPLHGGYTTYTTFERARKAAEKISWLHANLRVEEDRRPINAIGGILQEVLS